MIAVLNPDGAVLYMNQTRSLTGFSSIGFPEQPVGLRLPAGFKIPHSQRFELFHEKAQLLKILEADWNARMPMPGSRIQCSVR